MSNAIPIIIEPHEPERGKYRVAAYCRVSSSSDEQMHSYYAQVGYYKKLFAEVDSYVFVGVYGDAGISGTRTCNRDGFLKLIEDCRNGLVDCIWTKSVSRFGRNTVDTLIFTRELRNLGIDVFFEKENIHSIDSSGELLLTLMAAFAESESKNMSANIAWGKRKRFAEGLVQAITIGGLLGFRQENGVVTVVEEEAEIVRKIFHKYLDCYNFGEIAEMLNQENAPKRFKGKWSRTEVRNIILNEKYAGDCLLQKSYIINPIEHRSVPNEGQLTQYFVEGCYPAIVKKDDWLVAREMAKSLSNRSVVNSDERPFVGMMYCAVCGKQCKIHTTVGMGGNPLRRYRCVSFKDNSGVEIPGMTYVRPHTSRYIKNPTPKLKAWREKYAPPQMTRQYYCSDTRTEADHPYEAFIKAWNYLITNKQRYLPTIYNMISAEDILLRFNASVMYKLLSKGDMLHEFDTRLFRKTVDRIEVHPSGKLTFMFKTGLKITK